MVANLLFTVAAVVVVLARPVDLTTAVVAVLAGGVYTLVFADLQYLGCAACGGEPLQLAQPEPVDRVVGVLAQHQRARGRVGRMFSIRLGRLIECQMSRAAATACWSVRSA